MEPQREVRVRYTHLRVNSIHMVMDVVGVEVVNWRETESKTRIESRTETLGNRSVLRAGKEEETPTPQEH